MGDFKGHKNSSLKPNSIPFKICLCKYCGRTFLNAQALGGHQNAHKKERQEAKDYKQEMTSTMMSSFGMPLMLSSFVQPHGLAQHLVTEGQPDFSRTFGSSSIISSFHPVINYWPGSYCVDEGILNSQVPAVMTSQVEGATDGAEQLVERGCASDDHQCPLVLNLPDLNLDPPL